MTTGHQIKQLRKAKGLSQERLAEALGISRQAVAKWESDLSTPTTDNLHALAQILGTTTDRLLSDAPPELPPEDPISNTQVAQELFLLQQQAGSDRRQAQRREITRRLRCALLVLLGYLVIYLAGRLFFDRSQDTTLMTLLFSHAARYLPYLYGWLLTSRLFYWALGFSAAASLLGRCRLGLVTTVCAGAGILLGEAFGRNPAGSSYGFGHYGWLIWCLFYLLSMVLGLLLEKLPREELHLSSRRLRRLLLAALAGTVVLVLLVRLSIPTHYGT